MICCLFQIIIYSVPLTVPKTNYMKRRKFTFAASYAGAHTRGMKPVCLPVADRKRRSKASRLCQYLTKSLRSSPLLRTGAAACLAIALGLPARAQQPLCNTFQNADAANPIYKLLRPGEGIEGLDFVDIDADGDLDCYVKIWEPEYGPYHFPVLFRNAGSKDFPVFVRDDNSGFENTSNVVYSYSDVQFADMDGDGDFDCFIAESYPVFGGLNGTTIHYFENTGTAQKPVFVSNEAGNPIQFYSFYGIGFSIADIDGDGDLDIDVSPDFGFYGQTTYINTGTKTNPQFDNGRRDNSTADHRIFYDWNKDGLLDYFDDGAYHQNIGPRSNPKYTTDSTGPQFGNGAPYRFVDLNNDGFPEVFSFSGAYSTLAPVAVITAKPGQQGSFSYTLLTSTNQSPDYKYQWKLNGKDITGATRPSYPAARAGKYTLAVTGSCGTGLSQPYILRKRAGAAADDALIADRMISVHPSVLMQAYPNPFTHSVTLRIAQPASGGSLVKMCDLRGRIFLTKQTADAMVQVGENLPRGTYLVQVWQKDGLVFSGKVMKE